MPPGSNPGLNILKGVSLSSNPLITVGGRLTHLGHRVHRCGHKTATLHYITWMHSRCKQQIVAFTRRPTAFPFFFVLYFGLTTTSNQPRPPDGSRSLAIARAVSSSIRFMCRRAMGQPDIASNECHQLTAEKRPLFVRRRLGSTFCIYINAHRTRITFVAK